LTEANIEFPVAKERVSRLGLGGTTVLAVALALAGCTTEPTYNSGGDRSSSIGGATPGNVVREDDKKSASAEEQEKLSPRQKRAAAQSAAAAAGVAILIAKKLQEVADQCKALGRPEYQIDCLGDGFAAVSQDMPADAEFGDARAAIAEASRSLNALAEENKATDLPPIERPNVAGQIVPVAVDRLAASRERAARIVEETQTVLLRSSETDPAHVEPYQRIVAALDSSKVLLRS
jgi:hypothetical protein